MKLTARDTQREGFWLQHGIAEKLVLQQLDARNLADLPSDRAAKAAADAIDAFTKAMIVATQEKGPTNAQD